MKRINNLYQKICTIENLQLADELARKNKEQQHGVIVHDRNREANILQLHKTLINKSFKTSRYNITKVYEPKERTVYCLPYFPDRILHHAVMNILEPIWVSVFTRDTYSCIKGKGIHAALRKVKKDFKNIEDSRFCLKIDVSKFYPSMDHDIIKEIIRKKIKDQDLLNLLDEIIDSVDGIPIGNYLSQYFGNLYLAYLDWWIKAEKKVKYYYRYTDDMVFLSNNKEDLHKLLIEIDEYLTINLNLKIKGNYQIFPISARGLDFIGYKAYHTHVRIRKSIKVSFAKVAAKRRKSPSPEKFNASIASYKGWAKHANCKHLVKKLLHENI